MGEITTLPITTRKSTELPASSAVSAINHIVAYEGAENVRIPLSQLDTYVVNLVTTNAPVLTASQIKSSYESNANTNEFSDAEQTKLTGIEVGATTDQTPAQVKTSYESNADTNEFSDAEQSKLAGLVSAIGEGQSWQDMSGSRAIGVTYTNSTGKTIMVCTGCIGTTSGSLFSCLCDGFTVVSSADNTGSKNHSGSFLVPNGSTYSLSSSPSAISFWSELR